MIRFIVSIFSLIISVNLSAQQSIDGTVDFENEIGKKFSIYLPSAYDENVANKLIVGFHPLNTNRWDSESWRDTLIDFAESVDAILLCPDGGPDGKVDDPIDTSFTSFMLDSIQQLFNIDIDQLYGMGFSWGGRTTYTYGLHRPGLFKGHLVIGAAINGLNEVGPLIDNAMLKTFYLVHGSNDNIAVRFNPVKNALEDIGACIESNLLAGVGHTIDFPDRNNILLQAFNWIENRNCGTSSSGSLESKSPYAIYPNPFNDRFELENLNGQEQINIYSLTGQSLSYSLHGSSINIVDDYNGVIIISIKTGSGIKLIKAIKI